MPTLYYAAGTCSLAPHIVLEWIGAPYETVQVQLGSAELLAVNPAGAVPVLREEDGWLLTQAGAILEYLAAKHPEAGLSGGGSLRERAEANRWSSFFTGDLHPSFYPIFLSYRYTADKSDDAKAKVAEAGQALVIKQLGILNKHLEGRDWVLGDGTGKRSVIDAYAFPMIQWAIKVLPDGISAFPSVQALHDRIKADPAVQKVLARESGK